MIQVRRGDYRDKGFFASGGHMADDKLNDRPVEEGGLKKGGELGGKEVQAKMDEEQEQGYRGFVPDPTPNENYTVKGVTSGAPTPENNPQAAAEAGSGKFRDVNPEPSKPAEKVALRNAEGREIRVSEKLKTNYPEYKGEASKKPASKESV
jgi:hypothetical protein